MRKMAGIYHLSIIDNHLQSLQKVQKRAWHFIPSINWNSLLKHGFPL